MTQWRFVCLECGRSTEPRRKFEALRDTAEGRPPEPCGSCGSPTELQLTFAFALGAGALECRVLGAFLPSDISEWEDAGAKVQFFPFLVVLEDVRDGGRNVWLPYWHLLTHDHKVRRKYGQWAPFLSEGAYIEPMQQARSQHLLSTSAPQT